MSQPEHVTFSSSFDKGLHLLKNPHFDHEDSSEGSLQSLLGEALPQWQAFEDLVNDCSNEAYTPKDAKLWEKRFERIGGLWAVGCLASFALSFYGLCQDNHVVALGGMGVIYALIMSLPVAQASSFVDKRSTLGRHHHNIVQMIGYGKLLNDKQKERVYQKLEDLYKRQEKSLYFWQKAISLHKKYTQKTQAPVLKELDDGVLSWSKDDIVFVDEESKAPQQSPEHDPRFFL